MKSSSTVCLNPFPARLASILVFVALLSLSVSAHAQLTLRLTPDTLNVSPGNSVTFSGTLTNIGPNELFLNSDNYTLNSPDLTLDDSPFLTGFPLSLPSGDSASGEMFTVTVAPGAAYGLFPGSFTVLGGPSGSDFNELVTQNFSVAVPEPGILALLLSGGIGLGIVERRRKRAADHA